jgi:mono/diheme cytochrome c family protein
VKFQQLLLSLVSSAVLLSSLTSCETKNSNKIDTNSNHSSPEFKYYSGKGVGPITSVMVSTTIDTKMLADGEILFQTYCSSCHKPTTETRIGPGLAGISERRTPEYIMNMILNPMEMTQKDSLSKELLLKYSSQMLDNNLKESEARSILEYLRTIK